MAAPTLGQGKTAALLLLALLPAGARARRPERLLGPAYGGLAQLSEEELALAPPSAPGLSREGRWDLLGALADRPPGAYHQLLDPVSEALNLSYTGLLGPQFAPGRAGDGIPSRFSGGGSWEREFGLEANPREHGIHAVVFSDRAAGRALVAFRGACFDTELAQCRADKCVLKSLRSFGELTDKLMGGVDCGEFLGSDLDYLGQADALVRRVQAALAGFAVLLAGHSLGGALASVAAASQPGVLQAVTFAPTPFHEALGRDLHLTEGQIGEIPTGDIVSTCDPFDCGINSALAKSAREGSMTCLYFGTQEPPPCHGKFDDVVVASPGDMLKCKVQTHHFHRYQNLVREVKDDGITPMHIPTCSLKFSTLASKLERRDDGWP